MTSRGANLPLRAGEGLPVATYVTSVKPVVFEEPEYREYAETDRSTEADLAPA